MKPDRVELLLYGLFAIAVVAFVVTVLAIEQHYFGH